LGLGRASATITKAKERSSNKEGEKDKRGTRKKGIIKQNKKMRGPLTQFKGK
jgi:hypothetical protein